MVEYANIRFSGLDFSHLIWKVCCIKICIQTGHPKAAKENKGTFRMWLIQHAIDISFGLKRTAPLNPLFFYIGLQKAIGKTTSSVL